MMIALALSLFACASLSAEWVNGYLKRDGTYVSGYYRTDRNLYKYDNKSYDGDAGDIYNDRSYQKKYGYDPEPFDNDRTYPRTFTYENPYEYKPYNYPAIENEW